MPEFYKVKFFHHHSCLLHFGETLIAARSHGEKHRLAREAARLRGAGFWTVEG